MFLGMWEGVKVKNQIAVWYGLFQVFLFVYPTCQQTFFTADIDPTQEMHR